jgi:uncharacterized membrane protein YfcA
VIPVASAAVVAFQAGVHVFLAFDPIVMKRAMGIAGVICALLPLLRIRWGGNYSLIRSLGFGAMAGVASGATGIAGPFVPLYIIQGQDTAVRKRATLVVFTGLLQAVAAPSLFIYHILTFRMFLVALTILPVAALMTHVGTKLFERTDEALFEKLCLALIIAIGLAAAIA